MPIVFSLVFLIKVVLNKHSRSQSSYKTYSLRSHTPIAHEKSITCLEISVFRFFRHWNVSCYSEFFRPTAMEWKKSTCDLFTPASHVCVPQLIRPKIVKFRRAWVQTLKRVGLGVFVWASTQGKGLEKNIIKEIFWSRVMRFRTCEPSGIYSNLFFRRLETLIKDLL